MKITKCPSNGLGSCAGGSFTFGSGLSVGSLESIFKEFSPVTVETFLVVACKQQQPLEALEEPS